MKIIQFTSAHRQKHFDFFNSMANPHFNLCGNVDISKAIESIKEKRLPFHTSMVFLISKTANAIPSFRWRIQGGEIMEHEIVHPSFTVNTEEADVFSFCYVDFIPEEEIFIPNASRVQNLMKSQPSIEDEADRDDFLFLSSIPWISFTSMQHAMHSPADSVPRITWGKYFEQEGKMMMPLSVQVHHALVDGRQVGEYFELFQKNLDSF